MENFDKITKEKEKFTPEQIGRLMEDIMDSDSAIVFLMNEGVKNEENDRTISCLNGRTDLLKKSIYLCMRSNKDVADIVQEAVMMYSIEKLKKLNR